MVGARWTAKSGVMSAVAWGTDFFVAAIGVRVHSIALLYRGYGAIGGCGLGLGYITPVSTLIRWFPDRRGMATGMAIMGFGGGAMIASPLSELLMRHYATATSTGVSETFMTRRRRSSPRTMCTRRRRFARRSSTSCGACSS